MSHRTIGISCAIAGAFLVLGATAHAEILDTGVDTEKAVTPETVISPASICRILWLREGGADAEVGRLQALGHDVTIGGYGMLNATALEEFGVLVLAYFQPGILESFRPVISDFVVGGGGLLIHQPNSAGTLDYTPAGFDVTMSGALWCNGASSEDYVATIVDAGHPVTVGLADSDLSGDYDIVESLGPGFSVLTRNAVCNTPALAAGTTGTGRVLLDTGNANLQSLIPGTELYWDRVFGWLCTPGTISVEPSTWGAAKAMYR
jgi:hypothetical protein